MNPNASSFKIILRSNQMQSINPNNPLVHDVRHNTSILEADLIAPLPTVLKLPANQWWGVRCNWMHVFNRICNVKLNSQTHSITLNTYADGSFYQKKHFLSSYSEFIESIDHLVKGLNALVEGNANKIEFSVLETGQVSLKIEQGEIWMSHKIALTLGLLGQAIPMLDGLFLFPGSKNAYVSAPGDANIMLLGPQFVYLKLDIISPIIFGDRFLPIVACLCLPSLRKEKKNLDAEQYITYPHSFSREKSILDLNMSEIRVINMQLLNENLETIKFCLKDPEQICFELELEFLKGGNLYSLF